MKRFSKITMSWQEIREIIAEKMYHASDDLGETPPEGNIVITVLSEGDSAPVNISNITASFEYEKDL